MKRQDILQISLIIFTSICSICYGANTQQDNNKAKEIPPKITLLHVQQEWAKITYQPTLNKDSAQSLLNLITATELQLNAKPDKALMLWLGILHASYAKEIKGLGALKYLDMSEKILLNSVEENEALLDGTGLISLGALYLKSPKWPISIGNYKKSKAYLKTALKINKDHMDANYFYALVLRKEKEYKEAMNYLIKAYNAPPRKHRPLADKGRKALIKQEMIAIKEEMN